MKIEKVIQSGECVSKSEMVKLCGGFGMMDNTTKALITCSCSGSADNSNSGLWCSCDSNGNLKPTPITPTPKPGPNPGDTLKPILDKQN